jgi:hypothetical protein
MLRLFQSDPIIRSRAGKRHALGRHPALDTDKGLRMHRDMNHDTTSTFISAMVQAEPALMPVLDDHRAANGGLLPHYSWQTLRAGSLHAAHSLVCSVFWKTQSPRSLATCEI